MGMAQSQPMFLAMMGMEGKLKAELDRREKLAEIQDLTPEVKRRRDSELWTAWLETYEETLAEQRDKAIAKAEEGDFEEVQNVLHLLENPFAVDNYLQERSSSEAQTMDQQPSKKAAGPAAVFKSCSGIDYASRPPEWADELKVT